MAPCTGDLLVTSAQDLAAHRTRERFRRLGVDFEAPEWDDHQIFTPVTAVPAVDSAVAGHYSAWQRRERLIVAFLRSWLGLSSLARRAARARSAPVHLDRQAALGVIASAGSGTVDECLVTSFVQVAFLLSCGIDCTLSIGCWTPTINMHAWVSVAEPDDPRRHCLVSEPLDRVSLYRPSLQFEFRHAGD